MKELYCVRVCLSEAGGCNLKQIAPCHTSHWNVHWSRKIVSFKNPLKNIDLNGMTITNI